MPGETPEVYYRLVLFIPFLDDLLEQLESRISTMSTTSLIDMKLLPGKNLSDEDVVHLEEVFGDDMPSRGPPHAYDVEQKVGMSRPADLLDTLAAAPGLCMVPKHLQGHVGYSLVVISAISAGVKRTN